MFDLLRNSDAYCWLKRQLEPRYTVVAEPNAGYFDEWSFCYQVFDGNSLVREFRGDFRQLREGELVCAAADLVAALGASTESVHRSAETPDYPVASRLPPARTPITWFSSGRAAFAWVVKEQINPRRLHLPALICWSLVNVMRQQFPEVELCFYPVSRHLEPQYPDNPGRDEAVLYVHYFGYRAPPPAADDGVAVLEDCSHLVSSFQPMSDGFAFGSLRKIYPTADGGYLRGSFNPVYEPDRGLDAWLRHEATDWKDLREAENMTDRHWTVSDISSQSLATILSSDDQAIIRRRQANESILARDLCVGIPMKPYATDECPLLHNRFLPGTSDRDSLRRFLAARDIYCSIHWPVHPAVTDASHDVDITDALWIQDHVVSIPVSQNYGADEMERICAACDEWNRAGSARFANPAA